MSALWGNLIGVVTVVLMLVFLGIWVWAWRPRHREVFATLARIPMDDGRGELVSAEARDAGVARAVVADTTRGANGAKAADGTRVADAPDVASRTSVEDTSP